jgi:hypothetical protein
MPDDFSPYRSPQSYDELPRKPSPGDRPPQYWLYQLYCGLMAALYLLAAALGVFLIYVSSEFEGQERIEAFIYGVVFMMFCPIFAMAHAVGPFLPARRWAWIYAVVLIGLGLNSCCTWPLSIPLLLVWIKKETQAYFP